MKLKAKLTSLVITCCLIIGVLITGIYAASTGSVSIGGSVSFEATDIYAQVSATIRGTNETVKPTTLNWSAAGEPTQEEKETWTNMALSFLHKDTPIKIEILVENLSEERPLYLYLQDEIKNMYNINKGLTLDGEDYTGSLVIITPEKKQATFVISFEVDDANYSIDNIDFGYVMDLFNDRPNILVSSDETKGTVVDYEVNGDKLSFEVQTQDNVQFVGFRNVDTGEYELLNVPNQAQVEALRLIGDYTFADAYMGEFVNSKAIYNVDPYYQAISSFPREDVVAQEQNVPGITAEFDRFVAKKDLYEVDYTRGTAYEAVFTSGGTESTENGITYIAYPDAGLTMIKSYTLPEGSNGVVEIPAALGGQPVKGMFINYDDTAVFKGNISNMTILAEMLNIGYRAFNGCTTLENITLPDSLTKIEGYAFLECSNLKSISIPDGVTSIASWTFRNCSSLTEITIPDSVTSIGDYALSYCSSLTEITIPEGVTSIGDSTFSGCRGLTEITIPDSVTSIGGNAFSGCSALESIELGNGVTSIGDYAFSCCGSLTSIEIPDSVTGIGNEAFSYCSELKNISIPDSVTSIGDFAFYECSSLTEITIPEGVTSIGYWAFNGCSQLTTVIIDSKTISSWLTSGAANGYVINYATTIYIKTGLTVGSYVTSNFKTVEVIKSGEFAGYTKYSKS